MPFYRTANPVRRACWQRATVWGKSAVETDATHAPAPQKGAESSVHQPEQLGEPC